MKIVFLGLICIHGLIHLLGFVKAFDLAEIKQLSHTISKPMGLIWLLACLLFILTAILIAIKHNYWWIFGFIAVVSSQILVFLFWNDARFATIPNVIIFLVSIIGYSESRFYNSYQEDVKKGLLQASYFQNSPLTEADIQHLPEPVKKYLRYTGSIGKPKVNYFKIEFEGKIRKDEQSEWMPFTSEQYNFMEHPTRLFFMKSKMKGLPISGYHYYNNGDAFMDIRLFSLFKVQYQEGKEMDISETVTFFNDMCCMAPPTLIDPRIKWLEVDSNTVKAFFTNNDITVSARLYFNDNGELTNFISEDRYAADTGKQLPWATPLKDYKNINGYNLFGNAETIYTYPDRDLCYGTFKLKKVEYNGK